MNIETGIYRHFKKGDLYFAEGLELDANVNTESWRVRYHALYPGKPVPFSRSLEGENGWNEMTVNPQAANMVKRFALVQELPVEKMQVLLPGTKIELSSHDPNVFRVIEVRQDKDGIFVQLGNTNPKISIMTLGIPLSEFLGKAFPVY